MNPFITSKEPLELQIRSNSEDIVILNPDGAKIFQLHESEHLGEKTDDFLKWLLQPLSSWGVMYLHDRLYFIHAL